MPDSHVALLARRLLDDGAVDTALQAFVAARLLLDAADALDDEFVPSNQDGQAAH